jgi:ankyrin repeat protein
MNMLIKNIMAISLSICANINAMDPDTTDLSNYIASIIKKHRNSPKKLGEFLIDMGKWEVPNLKAAKEILDMGIVTANVRDAGNVTEGYYGNPGATPIGTAASHGKTDYVELLLNYHANIETINPWNGFTPVMQAACYGHDSTVKLLISRGANVNFKNGTTALILAAHDGHLGAVESLLDAKADTTIKDEDEKDALDHAKRAIFSQYQAQYDKIVRLLNAQSTALAGQKE